MGIMLSLEHVPCNYGNWKASQNIWVKAPNPNLYKFVLTSIMENLK